MASSSGGSARDPTTAAPQRSCSKANGANVGAVAVSSRPPGTANDTGTAIPPRCTSPEIEPVNVRPSASGACRAKSTARAPTPMPSGPTGRVHSVVEEALTVISPVPSSAVTVNPDSTSSGRCGGRLAP